MALQQPQAYHCAGDACASVLAQDQLTAVQSIKVQLALVHARKELLAGRFWTTLPYRTLNTDRMARVWHPEVPRPGESLGTGVFIPQYQPPAALSHPHQHHPHQHHQHPRPRSRSPQGGRGKLQQRHNRHARPAGWTAQSTPAPVGEMGLPSLPCEHEFFRSYTCVA